MKLISLTFQRKYIKVNPSKHKMTTNYEGHCPRNYDLTNISEKDILLSIRKEIVLMTGDTAKVTDFDGNEILVRIENGEFVIDWYSKSFKRLIYEAATTLQT